MNILDLKRKLLPLSGPQSDGGGGGGGSSTGTQTNVTELPEWARGYAKDTLAKAAAVTDLNQNPYQQYTQDRIAGFSPMQLQSQQNAANMQPNQATGAGIGAAGQATLGALNTNYQGGQFNGGQFGGQQAAQYMNPFVQQALAPQMQQIQRSGEQQKLNNAGQATQAGAFGGSRFGIQNAMTDYNTQLAQSQAYGSGMQNAFNNAQNQFNADAARNLQAQQLGEQSRQYGAGLGLQGLQTALTGANTLGALGGQQFQQGMDINKLQNAYGGQQQALRQQGLDLAYQDFQNQQNYPYKQLGFMSDMIRGLPVGQASTKSIYEPAPSAAQQVGALGMGALGLSKFMAEGGMAYADGGSVEDTRNIESIVSKLSDQQLQQAAKAAQARGDQDELQAIQNEMAMRASERNGIAGGVTNEMADRMAGGGVVAFANGGLGDYMKNVQDAATEDIAETPEQRLAGIKGALPGIQSLYGESALKPFMEDLKKDRADLATQKSQGEGLAFLAGAKGLLRPGNKGRAVVEAMSEVGTGLAKANKDYSDSNAKLRQAEMTLAASEQARADGQIGKAESLYDKGREDKKEAIKRKMDANEKLATIQASVDNSIRQTNASMASVNKPGETERMLADLDQIRTGKKTFQGLTGEEGAKAYQDSVGQLGAARYGVKYTGPNKDFEHKKAVLDVLQKDEGVKIAQMKVAQLEAKDKLSAKEQAALDANKSFLQKRYESVSTELQKSGASAPGAAPAAGKNVISMADIQRTAESSGKTVEEVRAAAAAKGYTIQ